MRCAWNELLSFLPQWLRRDVDNLGRESLRELRLRLEQQPELVVAEGSIRLDRIVRQEDLKQCISGASRYSPWNAASMEHGYLTAPGGHRIGICGEAVIKDRTMAGIREVTSVCIRVARDFPGIADQAAKLNGSILILGPPGWGKTTLLRDLIRQLADRGEHVAVVDERGELFPLGGDFQRGSSTDVLSGCPKAIGIDMVLRTMGPSVIAVDEITAKRDCEALIHALWCGVRLVATAHAASVRDFRTREIYRPLLETGIFANVLLMRRDKSWRLERMDI